MVLTARLAAAELQEQCWTRAVNPKRQAHRTQLPLFGRRRSVFYSVATSASGGPLPFPRNAGRQVSGPNLPSALSR